MSFIQSIILGLVQGIAEFLPISSSGHLVIFQQFFGLADSAKTQMLFDVFLHLGTLVAVFIAFWKTICNLFTDFFKMIPRIFSGHFSYKKSTPYQKMIIMILVSLVPLFFVLPFTKQLETLFQSAKAVGFCLLITAVLLFIADKIAKGKKTMNEARVSDSIFIGVFQAIATLPGVSRSGATITAGLFRGFSRELAVEFSFIMSIPAILGANILTLKDAFGSNIDLSSFFPYIVGAVVAGVSGYFAIKLISYLVKKDKFGFFAYYCAIVGVVTIVAAFILNK